MSIRLSGYQIVSHDGIFINVYKKKFYTVGKFPKFIGRIEEIDKIDITNTQIHDHSLLWLDTVTSIKVAGFS